MAEPWGLELLLQDAPLPQAGGHAGGEDLSAAFEAEDLLLPELPTWTADAGARGMRCLDSGHGAECSRCACSLDERLRRSALTRARVAAQLHAAATSG